MKAYLITDSGHEHCTICAVVLGEEKANMQVLKKEFEEYVNFKPINRLDNIGIAHSDKRKIEIDEALGRLIDDDYADGEEVLDEETFLTGFANWLGFALKVPKIAPETPRNPTFEASLRHLRQME
jgi:hypothetical protein